MENIPIDLSGYQLRVTEPPSVKMRELEDGSSEPVVNRAGETQFMVVLFAKPRPVEGQRQGKGSEFKVNLPSDPGEGFIEGSVVELIAPRVNNFEIPDAVNPRLIASAGLWFKAEGLKPVGDVSSPPPYSGGFSDDLQ